MTKFYGKCFSMLCSILLLSSLVLGQTTFKVGDEVEAIRGSTWVPGRIESISGNIIKVRFGPGRYDFQNYDGFEGRIQKPGTAADNARNVQRWNAFNQEASNYRPSVVKFVPYYDSRFAGGGLNGTPDDWQKVMSDLAALDQLCRTKYAGITDWAGYIRDGDISNRFATWCDLAAKRTEIEKVARREFARDQNKLTVTEDNLKFAFEHQKNRVPEETQQLMYDRAKWEQEMTVKFKPRFAQYGVDMPADFFKTVEARADELKALIDRTAPTRAWEPPPFHDAAVEAFVRGKLPSEYPGVQVLKIGLDYNTWVERKGLSYVGSDSSFRYYKVEYNYYKRGWALIKVPNRPYCQASEWIVGRAAKGMVVVSLGGSGIFMKCQ